MEKKKEYAPVEFEIIDFDRVDIITTSEQLGSSGWDESGWTVPTSDWN